MNVLMRCDGSPEIGLGHIVRCLALADELRDVYNCRIFFAVRKGPLGIKMVAGKGYNVITVRDTDHTFNYRIWLTECVSEAGAQMIVFDVRDGLTRAVLKELRNNGILIITIDDPEDKRLEADLAFYPPVPQVKRMDWTGFTGKLYAGWEWVILRPEFAAWRKKQESIYYPSSPIAQHSALSTQHPAPIILVTMGGSDPAGLTIKAVQALNMLSADFHVMIVLGPGFVHHDSLKELLHHAEYKYTILENVTDMASVMAQIGLAVAAFGVTAYELATTGVPAIYLCLSEDHAESASAFVGAGMAVSLGEFKHVNIEMIAMEIRIILNNQSLQSTMAGNASKHVDGQGVMRISRLMTEKFNAKNE